MRDEKSWNYFNVVIDGDSVRYFKADSVPTYHTLVQGLTRGEHTVEIIKRNESGLGRTWLYGLQTNGNFLPHNSNTDRVIEFFGNSITVGYAIEDYTGGDSPDSTFTNNYFSYAAITARHFNADYYCTSKSGIGILVSWFPLTMPEMYDRLDPTDPKSKWDFKKVTPDIVVINLFQNDSWLVNMPDHPSFKERFGNQAPDKEVIVRAYRSFVSAVRDKYPDALIICALGNMDATKEGSLWPGYVSKAVSDLNDKRILTHFFPFMNKAGHPRKEDNELMAKSLIDFIKSNSDWK
jgi:hypothetical protein